MHEVRRVGAAKAQVCALCGCMLFCCDIVRSDVAACCCVLCCYVCARCGCVLRCKGVRLHVHTCFVFALACFGRSLL